MSKGSKIQSIRIPPLILNSIREEVAERNAEPGKPGFTISSWLLDAALMQIEQWRERRQGRKTPPPKKVRKKGK